MDGLVRSILAVLARITTVGAVMVGMGMGMGMRMRVAEEEWTVQAVVVVMDMGMGAVMVWGMRRDMDPTVEVETWDMEEEVVVDMESLRE